MTRAVMARRVLLLVKPFDVFPPRPPLSTILPPRVTEKKVLNYLNDRCRVHKDTVQHCRTIAERKFPHCHLIMRNDISSHPQSQSQCIPILIPHEQVDLVITIGGDGTLLKASHFLTDHPHGSVPPPVLGVNSDPTNTLEVEEMKDQFDATRSTGYLCAATRENFEQVLDEILEGKKLPTELSRLSLKINGQKVPTFALNDILMAHPCPASVTRFSFRIRNECGKTSRLVNCRSSGLRVCTAAGSTAAMQSAGGTPMHISMRDLQYMVREPIFPQEIDIPLMHGFINSDSSMVVSWYSQDGMVYFDGSHVYYKIKHGDEVEVASDAPVLNVFLPGSFLI